MININRTLMYKGYEIHIKAEGYYTHIEAIIKNLHIMQTVDEWQAEDAIITIINIIEEA